MTSIVRRIRATASSGGGGGQNYTPPPLGTQYDPNNYLSSSSYNAATGALSYVTDATALGSDAITGPSTSEAGPARGFRLDSLDGFDPDRHALWVQFSNVSLPNEPGRLGLAAVVSPNENGGSADSGGVGIAAFGSLNDDRGLEMSNTSGVVGTPTVPAGKITDAECIFVFLDSGQVVCEIWYKTANAPEERFRGSRRDIVMSSSRLGADEMYLRIQLVKFLSTAAADGATVSATVKVGYQPRPT